MLDYTNSANKRGFGGRIALVLTKWFYAMVYVDSFCIVVYNLCTLMSCLILFYMSGVLCQKQVSREGTSNHIPLILWDVITCPCPWYWLAHNTQINRDHRYVMAKEGASAAQDIAPWWRHQMETFSAFCPFMRGIHRSPVNSPHKGQWRGALMFSLIYV